MSNRREATYYPHLAAMPIVESDLEPAVPGPIEQSLLAEQENATSGYVRGFAFAPAEVRAEHEKAQEELAAMDLDGAVLRREPGYNQFIVVLDPAKTGHLTNLQKVVLADGGLMAPFGGYVRGDRVTVYTD